MMRHFEPAPANPRAVLLLLWLPLAILLPVATSQQTADAIHGLWFGACSAAVGGVLMLCVWRLSATVVWLDHPRVRVYLAHLPVAVLFAIAWRTGVLFIVGLLTPAGPLAAVRVGFTGPLVIWDLMFKAVVYALVIALAYAMRQRDRARAERLRSAQLDALSTRAQLAALHAQLNPHFLFNTLHSLSVLIRREPEAAEAAVDRLSDLLRFVLRHSDHDDIPLKDELQFVRNYLALEQLRLEPRLRVTMDIDPRALGIRVPPFCLQPLVENAIRHGLAPLEQGGNLWVVARVERDSLRLVVRDDGVGAVPGSDSGRGSGLASLRKRLDARGGGTIAIDAAPGRGFTVTVTIVLDDDIEAVDVQPAAS